MSTTFLTDVRKKPGVKSALKGATALRAKPEDEGDARERRKRTRNRPGVAAPVVETEILTTEEAAAYLKLSPAFLEMARYRGDGSGPPYCKLPRAVRYRKSQLDAWMAQFDHPGDRPIKSGSVA